VAFSLGITEDIANAVSLLRRGWRMKIDVGRIHCGRSRYWFLEAVGLGLVSNIFPLADDIQHGDLTVIGGLLSTFVSAEPSRLRIILDRRKRLDVVAHMLLITNMPYLGPRFQISPEVSYQDGRLDLFTFSDVNKLNMISYAMLSQIGVMEDIGIKHYRVKRVKVRSVPSMSVLADGFPLGEGSLSVHIHPRALAVMTGLAPLDKLPSRKED
jgi:diacylglycerol kinase family enzyme